LPLRCSHPSPWDAQSAAQTAAVRVRPPTESARQVATTTARAPPSHASHRAPPRPARRSLAQSAGRTAAPCARQITEPARTDAPTTARPSPNLASSPRRPRLRPARRRQHPHRPRLRPARRRQHLHRRRSRPRRFRRRPAVWQCGPWYCCRCKSVRDCCSEWKRRLPVAALCFKSE